MGSDFLKCNLEKTGKARYVLRLLDGTEVLYKLSGSCTDEPQTVSFIDIDSGNILFVQKHCFLELVDKNELYKLKAGI
jgi:hypothetical protein